MRTKGEKCCDCKTVLAYEDVSGVIHSSIAACDSANESIMSDRKADALIEMLMGDRDGRDGRWQPGPFSRYFDFTYPSFSERNTADGFIKTLVRQGYTIFKEEK